MKAFETSIENVVYRFGLMMAIVIISISAGLPFLAILAVPVFLSALLAIKFEWSPTAKNQAHIKELNQERTAA